MDRIEYTLCSFAHNRRIAEENLSQMRESLSDIRYVRRERGFRYFLLYPFWVTAARKTLLLTREIRWKIAFYRRIESSLQEGDVALAIEALAVFCPKAESTFGTIQRIRRTSPTLENVLRSPNILRTNMLALRDELIALQTGQNA